MTKPSHEYDSPARWCHILFDFFICKQATEERQEMIAGGWGLFLLVGEALSCYPNHISTFKLFSCRRDISVCQRSNDPVVSTSGYRQKYIDLFLFSCDKQSLLWFSGNKEDFSLCRVERDVTGFLLVIIQLNVAHDISAGWTSPVFLSIALGRNYLSHSWSVFRLFSQLADW